VGSERRFFQVDRLSRLLLFFSEQFEGVVCGSLVFVGTAVDITFVVDVGLRVLDGKMPELVPLPLPSLGDVTNLATGPPGKTYVAPELKTSGSKMPGSLSEYAPGKLSNSS